MWNEKTIAKLVKLRLDGKTWDQIQKVFPNQTANGLRKAYYRYMREQSQPMKATTGAKILVLDIETSPLEVYTWGLFDQNISLDMIIKDWSILSFTAKFIGSDELIYMDTRNEKDVRNDKKLVKRLWELFNECDVILSQNGKKFDVKKINSRFLVYGFPPPTSFQQIDALVTNRKNFAHTSNKLDYITKKFCQKFKKSGHKKFPGFSLWKECLERNPEAWSEMEDYNKIDVLSLEEFYLDVLRPWDKSVNFSVYTDDPDYQCSCGSTKFRKNGFVHTMRGRYQRWTCTECGAHHQDNQNLLSKEKRQSLRK